MTDLRRWVPSLLMLGGCALVLMGQRHRRMPLREPLATLPRIVAGIGGSDLAIGEAERRVAGMSDYLLRTFEAGAGEVFSVYVGYYDYQTRGRSIHSPKNCLPGSGWAALASAVDTVPTALGPTPVNRYVLANQGQRVVVLYWYQGRGRAAADEYRVKFELLRDSALRGRSEEALVRIVVPLSPGRDEAAAGILAAEVARVLVPEVARVLPA